MQKNNTTVDKRLHLLLPQKGDLRISNNYCVITLTAIASKIYNDLLLNHIWPGGE